MNKLWPVVVLMVMAVTACGSSPRTEPTTPPTGPPVATITIDNFSFGSPPSVPVGATIAVTNADPANHSVTADEGNAFDVEVGAGETVLFAAPTAPGTYSYHCSYHPMMHGTLVVT